jgi:type I restriction enzyme S subunit
VSFKPYPKYKESGVEWLGQVPEHWIYTQLKRLVEPTRPITYGIVQAGPDLPDGVPYIRPADMSDEHGVESPNSLLRTSPEIAHSYARSTILTGDLVCSIGPSFGKVMVTPAWLCGSNLTQGTARIAVRSPNNPRYVFWSLRSGASVAQWESSVGGATFRALNLGPLAETVVLAPPYQEQTAIATFLDHETAKIDTLIAEQQRLIELLQEKRQSVISHAVTKGLNPDAPMKDSGIEWLGEVPEHWDVGPLKRFCSSLDGRRVPLSTEERSHRQGDYPYYGASGIIDSVDAYLFDEDLVLVSEDGANLLNRASPIAFVATGQYWVNNHAHIIRPISGSMHYWAERIEAIDLTPFVSGSAQPKFTAEELFNLRIAVPPTESERAAIQAHFLQEASAIEGLVEQAKRAVTLLQERRSALISAAVTGQIDVRDFAGGSEAA